MAIAGGRFPAWLYKPIVASAQIERTRRLIDRLGLHTVCQSARCPNQAECFRRKTATFMILGENCTRDCAFCAVPQGALLPPDPHEPERVAEAVKTLGLAHVVVTSVTRDDLVDGGAGHFAAVIHAVRQTMPQITIEVLTPDFLGRRDALTRVVSAGPDVFGHNIETVPRLYREVRPHGDFFRSLTMLRDAKELLPGLITKSGLMVGFGESREEVLEVMAELRRSRCDLLTLGQYLRPSHRQLPVTAYIPPETYDYYREEGLSMGFQAVSAGPWVRSSYRADEIFHNCRE